MTRPILDKQKMLLEAVNGAKTEAEHRAAELHLRHWREGVTDAMGWGSHQRGRLLMEADNHYLRQGHDGPMTGGIWLDWEPEAAKEVTRG